MSRVLNLPGALCPSGGQAALGPTALDLNAEREKIRREIEELERSLEPGGASIAMAVSDSTLSSDTDEEDDDSDSHAEMEMERAENSSDDDPESGLPQDPETCLQMNHVYQEVIQEKLEELELLIAQNKEQQKELLAELGGPKVAKAGDGRNLPANIFLGHFMKPYFKDKTTGIGPPANEDAKEKAAQGIKTFEQLHSAKWKSREKTLLQQSVASDRLQRMLQPKLLKVRYWNEKLEKVKNEMEKQILEKQIKEVEQEIEAINQLPQSDLLGHRFDEHDWEKISNIHFDGQRGAEELQRFWQNWEHPSINKEEWTEEEIEKLKKIAANHGCLDWQTIAQELGTNRTAFQCLQKYQVYNKDLKRKEWTRREDQMLLQLVQEMRVGSHIPYKKIAYYMEGRDSAQLIYRWTKSVDPTLRKGPWTPEEDAMLLAAVRKHGARDWYKIRTEVPGRSDAQCRDRYLKALHCDVKKGKWSLEEEEQLVELVQKHGLCHWSKIASELPHRTGSQCLSKWKAMIGSKKRYRPAKPRLVQESSSSSESSSEEVELDSTDSSEEETTSKEEAAFPSIDLWIPTRPNTEESSKGRYQTPSLSSPGSADAQSRSSEVPGAVCAGEKDSIPEKTWELNTLLTGISHAHSTDVTVRNPAEVMEKLKNAKGIIQSSLTLIVGFLDTTDKGFYEIGIGDCDNAQRLKDKASRCGKQVLRVTLEDVRRILRHNTAFQRKIHSKILRSSFLKLAEVSCSVGQQYLRRRAYQQERKRLLKLSLDRKLLMAVTPWLGNVLLPCTLQTGKMAFHQTKAVAVQEKMKCISLTSTPLFTLFIQLFQIDTKGCMKIIHERRLRQAEQLQANARRPQQASKNMETSSGTSSPSSAQRNSKRGLPRTAGLESSAPAKQGALPAPGQRQKPKTVSELLREKRLRESGARKALQSTVFVAPQVLLSGPLIIQSPAQQIIPAAQAGSKAAAVVCANSQVQCAAAPPAAFTPVAASTAAAVGLEKHSSSVPETGEKSPASSELQSSKELKEQALESSPEGEVFPGVNPAAAEKVPSQGGCNGQILAGSSASVVLQNQAFVPHQIAVVPVGIESGTNKLSLSAPVSCELNSNGPQQRPVSLLPALVTPQAGSHLIPNSILPFTLVVTPQALLPTAVQTVVSIPQGLPAAPVKSPCQTTVTSNGNASSLRVPPVPAGASTPQPSSAAPVCSDGSSKAPDSSAAQPALPADAASLHAVLLPQPQLPASTQGSDSQCALTLATFGKSHDSVTASTPSINTEGVVLQPGDLLPNHNVPRNSEGFAAQALKTRPIASKPPATQPADSPAQPTTSSARKNLLEFSLISLEEEGLVKEWLAGKRGVQVPSLQTRLPYLPPFLCNLKTLSKLLLQKAALEKQAACLLPSAGNQGEGSGLDLQAVRELVQQKLSDNPAYLLLKARFLAAFTLPAVLANLPPPKRVTTLSGSRKQPEESDEEEWQHEEEVSEEESRGNECLDGTVGAEPGDKDADLLNQGTGAEDAAAEPGLASCTGVADGSAPQIRRSARFRKRKRM